MKITQNDFESSCFRCGTPGHWSRICLAPEHLCKLYKESIKEKEKETNFTEHNGRLSVSTHFDAAEFLNDFSGNDQYAGGIEMKTIDAADFLNDFSEK